MNDTERKVIIKRVTDFGRKPKSAYQALRQAHDLLSVEGRWTQGDWFLDGPPEIAFENGSICGDWSCCAMGAVGLVTGEAQVAVLKIEAENSIDLTSTLYYEWENENSWEHLQDEGLSAECYAFLSEAATLTADDVLYYDEEEPVLNEVSIVTFNDEWAFSREDILGVFQIAMNLARRTGRKNA